MGPPKVAPAPPSDDDDVLTARETRATMIARLENKYQAEHAEWNRVHHTDPTAAEVQKALKNRSKQDAKAHEKMIDARKLKRFNAVITVKVVMHLCDTKAGTSDGERTFLLECMDSTYMNDLSKMVAARLEAAGYKKTKVRLLWLNGDGDTVPIDSQRLMEQYVDNEWCKQPWVMHVHEDKPKVGDATAAWPPPDRRATAARPRSERRVAAAWPPPRWGRRSLCTAPPRRSSTVTTRTATGCSTGPSWARCSRRSTARRCSARRSSSTSSSPPSFAASTPTARAGSPSTSSPGAARNGHVTVM